MGERRGVYGALWGNMRERNHLEDPGVDGSIILSRASGNEMGGGMDWIFLAQDRDRWWAVVNAVMNFRVP